MTKPSKRLAWLPSDGEMAQLIRAHDWAAMPLGPIEGWPARLKAAVDLMLAARQPSSIYWGPDNTILYNESYIAILGAKHPDALGRPYREVWPEVWDEYRPIIAATMAGKAHSFVDRPVPVARQAGQPMSWFTFSWTPLRDEAGTVAGFFCSAIETTERVLAEKARDKVEAELRENEARQAFLLELADTLRPLSDPVAIQAEVSHMLGEHLQADRTYYSEIDNARKLVLVQREHNRVGTPSLVRDYGFEFLKPLLDVMRQGRPFVSNDVRADPRLAALRPAYDALSVRSFVRAPLIRGGELVGSLGVANVAPRNWTETEVALLHEVADRTWDAIQRTRAEARLRESEAKYRSLFQSLGTGYCVIELVFDAGGGAADYTFLEVNSAWERQTGMSADVIGKRMRSLVPNPEQFWFDTYGRIARTGQPERFEHWSRMIGRWYTVDAFRIGTPEQHHVAVLFDDVTARKQRELNTVLLDEIGKDLARLSSPDEIMQAVGARVGAFLDVSGCVFVDVDEEKGEVTVHHGWTTEHVPSLKQTFLLKDYLTEEFSRASRAGETFIVRDTSCDERTDAENYTCLKIGAFVVVPFFWEGRWTAYFAVTSIGPRDWREEEIELLTEISNRLFSRVERARAEAALRVSEERHAFLLALADRLRPLSDAPEVLSIATRALGEHLGADRVGYAEDRQAGEVGVLFDYANGVPSLVGRYRYDDYGPELLQAFRQGRSVVRPDIANDPSLTAAEKEAHARLLLGATVNVPLLADGVLRAVLFLHFRTAHLFDERELILVQGVAERLWAAVQRVRAEAALRESEQRFRGFAENSADVLWIADSTGTRLEYLSPAYERVFGEPRDAVLADRGRWRDLIHPDDRERVMSYMPRALKGETAVIHYRVVRPGDGRIVHLRDTGFLIRDAAGAITQVAGIVQDATDMVRTGEALEAEKERFRILAEGIPPLVWRSDAEGRWTWASPQWLAYTGQKQEESHGWGWLDAVHPDDREAMIRNWHEACPHGWLDAEGRVRRADDGAWRWHQTRSVPVQDVPGPDGAEGAILEWVGTMTDIDDFKHLQAQQGVLVAELQHRTRNLIAVVHSIAGETLRSSDTLEGFQQQFNDRLGALSRVQGLLSRSDQDPISLGALLRMELDALGGKVDSSRLTLGGPEVRLRKSTVQTLALALHELATNARKYGALAAGGGHLCVTWQVQGTEGQGRRLVLEWVEEGPLVHDGQDASSASIGGYGRQLIEQALPYALGARTSYVLDEAGVRCTIDIPLAGRVTEQG